LIKLGLTEFVFKVTVDPHCREWKAILLDAKNRLLEKHLLGVGSIPHHELATAYLSADVVYLPTSLECSSAVYPESFMAGVPVVTSDTDFARELCSDAALFRNPLDTSSCAQALYSICKDPKLGQSLVDRGRLVLDRNFPSPAEKWNAQLGCIKEAATRRPQSKSK